MKKLTLLALLALCTFGLWAENADPFPTNLVNQTKFTFTSLGETLANLQNEAFQTETHQTPTTGIDLYIHIDGDVVPMIKAWNGNGDLTAAAGDELTTTATVVRIGSDVKKNYYKVHFDASNLTFYVNYNDENNVTIQTNNMHVLENGSYFFDFVSYLGYDYNHTNNKAETHYTLAPINDYYNGGTSLNQNTIYAKSDVSNIPPSLFCFSGTWAKPWDQDWAHWGMNPTTINGDSQWRVNGPFNHDEIHSNVGGGLIISDWKNEGTKTCDITWLGGGDYFFYFYPYGFSDKFEPVVLMNGRTNYFQELTFVPNTTVTDDSGKMEISMIDENTIQFAQIDKDGFTLTVSDPRGMKAQELIVNNRLRLYLNSTVTFAQKDGHNINMFAHGSWHGNGNEDSSERLPFDTDQMLLAGSFNTPVYAPTHAWGNDYTLIGGDDPSVAFEHVGVVQSPSVSYTFTDPNYGINRKYVEFDSIRVRDARISSSLVDLYGTYRGFYWEITDTMVVVRYCGADGGHSGDGVIYCRSLNPSRTYVFPEPTQEQIDHGRIGSQADRFSNYDWLAVRLTPEMKQVWDDMPRGSQRGQIIKPGTIRGYYCDFIRNKNDLATAFLNPTIICEEMPELDGDSIYTTKLNDYYLFNFVKQDDVFFIPPKRNEVINLYYVLPSGDDNVVYAQKTEFTDTKGDNPQTFELKSKVRIYSYETDDVSGENAINDFLQLITDRSTYMMCRDGLSAIVYDALVQMIDHHGEHYYVWEPHLKENPNNNTNSEYLMAPRNAESEYFYSPIDDTESPGATTPGYLLPILDYGGGGDVLEVDGTIAKYYRVYPQHRLAINPILAVRTVPRITAVDELTVGSKDVAKTVATVEYYNATGMRSNTPFNGFNVVVTRYTDGSMSAKKIMKSN